LSGEHTMSVEEPPPVEDSAPARFDVRDFARTAVGSHRDEIDLAAFETRPLEPATLRVLAYARELERSTMTYLRNVLVTPTHKDARVTAFLTTWAFEKFWIADAFDVIVRAHGIDPTAGPKPGRVKAFSLEVAERATPIVEAFRANSIGPDVIGLHLSSVTIDEWITEAAYTRLAELDPHPVLVALLERVQTVKARHRLFVEVDARQRLEQSPKARSLAKRALPRVALPIGAASNAASETAFFYETLLDAPLADSIDDRVRSLPGLGSLHLVKTARAKALSGDKGQQNSTASVARWIGRTTATLTHPLHTDSPTPSTRKAD